MAARIDIPASRNVAFRTPINLYYRGGPLPVFGATVHWQIRLYPGASGPPLISVPGTPFLDEAAPTAQAPDRRRLVLSPVIAKAALAAMPSGLNRPEAGEADRFHHDIIIIYADAIDEKLAYGQFLLEPGVTKI